MIANIRDIVAAWLRGDYAGEDDSSTCSDCNGSGYVIEAWHVEDGYTEFAGWPVHLLGGSPHRQLHAAHYLRINSADGNYIQKQALAARFWVNGTANYAGNRHFPSLLEADGKPWGDGSNTADAPYEAFRRSCQNVMTAWRELIQEVA
jgi:hypothetical protein